MTPLLRVCCWWGLYLGGLGMTVCLAAESPVVRFESTETHMGVPFKIILYAADQTAANRAFAAAFARIAELDHVMSDYDRQSELSRLSRSAPTQQPVPLSTDLSRVLTRAQQLAARTDGAFDVTVGPYVRLWRRARRQKQLPNAERLDQARRAVGYKHLELDAKAGSARLLVPNMRLDLGGIAMGYAVDGALRVLRAQGVTRALVDASGDIGVADPPPDRTGWTIGVVPLSSEGTPSREIRLANAAVTTSGDAFQYVEIDGRRYSHIVDPRTGVGLTTRSGVTVIARDCAAADSLATAVSVLGPEAGLRLIDETPGAAAFVVQAGDDGATETYQSARFDRFVVCDSN